MKFLSFDAIQHLQNIIDDIQNMDCSVLGIAGENGGKLSRIIQKSKSWKPTKAGRVSNWYVDEDTIVDDQFLDHP